MLNSKKNSKKIIFSVIVLLALFLFKDAQAVNIGEVVNFNIDKNFDISARSQVSATLIKTTQSLYFYVEKKWWDDQSQDKKSEVFKNLDNLSEEFTNRIYPKLTSVFGSEWNPGIDNDNKITILFHQMKDESSGYFRTNDQRLKLQVPDSNEREMIYIGLSYINNPQLKVLVAHEFVHIITFNQKDRIWNVQEEVWLNEARADYSATLLGYDDIFDGSNLQKRTKDFLNSVSDSLTEWQETKFDYAVTNLFIQYLVDHYGLSILADSLKLKSVGIKSINEMLFKNVVKKDFAGIFTDWTVTMVINDCSFASRYCYSNPNLGALRISPTLIFLPLVGNSSLSVTNITKNWTGNWRKIIGGNGDLKLEFSNSSNLDFQVPYIIYDKNNNYSVSFLKFDQNKKGEINIKEFGKKYNSLIVIPSLQAKTSGFNGFEPTYPYTLKISITGDDLEENPKLIQELLDKIDSLKKQINLLLSQTGNGVNQNNNLCRELSTNLYSGITNNNDVKCLQQFLKSEGQDIYPEGLITGNFSNLTKSAVIRFQEKYKIFNTGFVGPITRIKINQLLK